MFKKSGLPNREDRRRVAFFITENTMKEVRSFVRSRNDNVSLFVERALKDCLAHNNDNVKGRK